MVAAAAPLGIIVLAEATPFPSEALPRLLLSAAVNIRVPFCSAVADRGACSRVGADSAASPVAAAPLGG